MKYDRFVARAVIAVLALGVFVGLAVAAETPKYSLAALKGDYVITEQGAMSQSVMVALGRMTFDGQGKVAGWKALQAAGINAVMPCEGTYTIDSDGVGTLTLGTKITVDGEEQAVLAQYKFLAAADETGIKELKAVRTENGLSVGVALSRMKPATDLSALKGAYILTEQGTLGSTAAAAATMTGLGLINFDGLGGVSGWETVQTNGMNVTTKFTGVYSFGADGAGTISINHEFPIVAPEGEPQTATAIATYKFMVVKNATGGHDLRAVRMENGVTINTILLAR